MEVRYDSSKEAAPTVVDTFVSDPWPRIAPDILDIDLVDENSVLQAKLLDGSPGWDGKGSAIHYGNMSGPIVYVYNADGSVTVDYSGKFSNPSCKPRWGVESNGLHYLESATDMTYAFPPGVTGNRLVNWGFNVKPCSELWSRYCVFYDPCCSRGQGNIGVKGGGMGGGGMSQTFEIGIAMPYGWDAQNYAYDAEGAQRVEPFTFAAMVIPASWYVIEEHVRVNTVTNGRYNADGIVEYKISGRVAFQRKDVLLFSSGTPLLDGFYLQFFDGGMLPVKSVVPPPSLRARHARIAVSTRGWIGPPKEWP